MGLFIFPHQAILSSAPELGVLHEVLTTALLNDGINIGVELLELLNLSGHALGSGSISVQVGSLAEEFSAEALMGSDENSVLVAVAGGRGILAEERYLPDKVTLLALGTGALLVGLVVNTDHLGDGALNLHNAEGSAEGVAGQ